MNPWLYRFNLVIVILFTCFLVFAVASFFFMENFFFSGILCLFAVLGITASIGSIQLAKGNRQISILATSLLVLLCLLLGGATIYTTFFFAYWNWLVIGFITLGFGGLVQVISTFSHWLKIPAVLTNVIGFLGIFLTLGLGFHENMLYLGTTLSLILHFVFFGFLVVQTGLEEKNKANK